MGCKTFRRFIEDSTLDFFCERIFENEWSCLVSCLFTVKLPLRRQVGGILDTKPWKS